MTMKSVLLAHLLVWSLASAALAAAPWTLEQAISHALANSPDARLAAQRIAAAQAGLKQANAAFSPQLQFGSSYLRTDNPMLVFGSILNQRAFAAGLDFNDVPDIDNANVKGLLTMPLYAGGRNAAARESAKANTDAARKNAEAVRNALAFEVARGFCTVLKAREFIKATEAGVRAFETNQTLAVKRMNAGSLLRADLLDVEVRLAQAREDLVRARNANTLALRILRNLVGVEQGEFEVASTAPAAAAPDSGDFSGRPELAVSAHRQRAAEAELRRAGSGFRPRINAFGSLDYDYGARTGSEGGSYTAGIALQWDLWDGLLTQAKREEAKAVLQAAREEERKLRLALDLEVEQARLALREANERLVVLVKAVALAGESADLTRVRFEQGIAIPTQLIDAETALLSARVRFAEAQAEQRIAVAALRKALGLSQLETPSARN
jgi:outer membrane protein